jgi:hypothetical protein
VQCALTVPRGCPQAEQTVASGAFSRVNAKHGVEGSAVLEAAAAVRECAVAYAEAFE